LECNYARDVSLHRQQLQVEHQAGVVGIGSRNTERAIPIRHWIFAGGRLGLLNATFDVADSFQILRDAIAIARSKCFLEPSEFFGHRIEQARPFLERRSPLGDAPLFAKQIFEHDPRMRFGRQRGRR
jgi:hypothetical protein